MIRFFTCCVGLVVLAGCPTPAPIVEPDDEVKETRAPRGEALVFDGQPVAVPLQFEPGCTPLSETEEIVGEVEMISFGKGARGVIINDGDVKWVVSYDASGVFDDFEKERVLATGRQCEKQGESIKAYHFEVRSLRVIAGP